MFGQDVDQRHSTGGELAVVDVVHTTQSFRHQLDAALEHVVSGREAVGGAQRIGALARLGRRHFEQRGAGEVRQAEVFGASLAQTDRDQDVDVAAHDLHLH